MLYFYIELRYLRQIRKISPETIEKFKNNLINSSKINGGNFFEQSGSFIITFDSKSCGQIFSASRVLYDLDKGLKEHSKRIKEFFIYIGIIKDYKNSEDIFDSVVGLKSTIYPDDKILLSDEACLLLESYCNLGKTNDGLFSFYLEHKGVKIPSKEEISNRFDFYISKNNNPFYDLIVLLDSLPKINIDVLSKEEQEVFEKTKKAIEVYKKFRFYKNHPEYRKQAIVTYAQIAFKALSHYNNSPVVIDVSLLNTGSKKIPAQYQSILTKISDFCIFKNGIPLEYKSFPAKDIPQDMLELIFLIYKIKEFFYVNEIGEFFNFIGKSEEFLHDLSNWLYNYGFIAKANDFRTLLEINLDGLEKKLGDNAKNISMKVGNFLWQQFEKGVFLPSKNSYKDLLELGYKVPSSFIIRCVLSESNTIEKTITEITDESLSKSIRQANEALYTYNSDQFSQSILLSKQALHEFQTKKIISYEFELLSLASFVSLAQKKIDDAIIYAEYTVDVSKQLFDPYKMVSSYFNLAIAQFLKSSYYNSKHFLEIAKTIANENYLQEWLVLISFLRGRISFELGAYSEAEVIFSKTSELSKKYWGEKARLLSELWAIRSNVYITRSVLEAKKYEKYLDVLPEASIFALEAIVLTQNFNSKFDLKEYKTNNKRLIFPNYQTDLPDIENSFDFIENLIGEISYDEGIEKRLYFVLETLIKINAADDENKEKYILELIDLTNKAQKEKDINTNIYFYFCYEHAKNIKSQTIGSSDIFLSKAFKQMQTRAKEIGDNAMRDSFMQKSFWNSKLLEAAREHKLI